jgi:hypothetical protein
MQRAHHAAAVAQRVGRVRLRERVGIDLDHAVDSRTIRVQRADTHQVVFSQRSRAQPTGEQFGARGRDGEIVEGVSGQSQRNGPRRGSGNPSQRMCRGDRESSGDKFPTVHATVPVTEVSGARPGAAGAGADCVPTSTLAPVVIEKVVRE